MHCRLLPHLRSPCPLSQVPLPCLSLPELQSLVVQHGNQVVSFVGVVKAVSTIGQRTYSRAVRCMHCGAEGMVLDGQALDCCNAGIAISAVQENLAGRCADVPPMRRRPSHYDLRSMAVVQSYA